LHYQKPGFIKSRREINIARFNNASISVSATDEIQLVSIAAFSVYYIKRNNCMMLRQ
jgi:hypothetical protein